MVLGVQVVGIIFSMILLYLTFVSYKKKELHRLEFSFWLFFWVAFLYLIIFPNSLDFFAESLNISRTLDFFTILGFMFLLALTFYNYVTNMHTQRKLERAVRSFALEFSSVPQQLRSPSRVLVRKKTVRKW